MDGLAGATGLSYDAAGNLTSANGMTLTWDAQGHLASVSGAPGGNVSFSYDYAGRRVSKTVNGVTTYYLYSGDALVCELDASGSVLRSYNWGACGLVSDHSASGSRYYLFDGHGNTRELLDASGAVLSLGAYTAWGTPLTGMAPSTPLGWNGRTGAYLDSETGLVLMGARYYAPCIGRSRLDLAPRRGPQCNGTGADRCPSPVQYAVPSRRYRRICDLGDIEMGSTLGELIAQAPRMQDSDEEPLTLLAARIGGRWQPESPSVAVNVPVGMQPEDMAPEQPPGLEYFLEVSAIQDLLLQLCGAGSAAPRASDRAVSDVIYYAEHDCLPT